MAILWVLVKWSIVLISSPTLGYGNSWDFIRQSSCHGIWQDIEGFDKHEKSADRVASRLKYEPDGDLNLCQYATDTLLGWLVAKRHRVGDAVSFLEWGIVRLMALLLPMIWLLFQMRSSTARWISGLLFFLVFSDLRVLLYINTLYLEFAALGALFSVALLYFLVSTRFSVGEGRSFQALTVFVLVALGFSKEQYLPLTILFGALIVPHLQRKSGKALVLLTLVVLPVAYYGLNDPNKGGVLGAIRMANRSDAILGAILPAAPNPQSALEALGLPLHCRSAIGLNWYSPGLQAAHPCPEVRDVGFLRLSVLFLQQPSALLVPLHQTFRYLRPLGPPLSEPFGPPVAFSNEPLEEESLRFRSLALLSISRAIESMSPGAFLMLNLGIMGSALIIWLKLAMGAVSRFLGPAPNPRPENWRMLIAIGGLLVGYAIFSSLIGDGYIEFQRHAIAVLPGYAFFLTGFGIFLFRFRSERT